MAAFAGPPHMLDDHTGLRPTIESATNDLAVATPQALHNLRVKHRCGPGCSGHDGLEISIHVIRPTHDRRLATPYWLFAIATVIDPAEIPTALVRAKPAGPI